MSASKDFKISPENIACDWGAFEDWAAGTTVAPTGWLSVGAGGTIQRDALPVAGNYAMRITSAAGQSIMAENYLPNPSNYAGKSIRCGCWIKTSSANKARFYIDDGATRTYSAFHPGSGAYKFIDMGIQVGLSNSFLKIGAEVGAGGIDGYFDCVAAVVGESIFTSLQDNKTFVRAVDTSPAHSFKASSYDVARRDGVYLQAIKVAEKKFKLRVQIFGDTMDEMRGYYQNLIQACSDGVKDLYISNDRIIKAILEGIPTTKYDADFKFMQADLQFVCPNPFERFIGKKRKTVSVTTNPQLFNLTYGGNYKAPPVIQIFATAAVGTIMIENFTTNQACAFGLTIAAGTTLSIDSDTMGILNNVVDGITGFTGDFMSIVPGTNYMRVSGSTNCVLNIDWFDRWL